MGKSMHRYTSNKYRHEKTTNQEISLELCMNQCYVMTTQQHNIHNMVPKFNKMQLYHLQLL